MQTATEAAPATGAAGPNPEQATVYQNSYQWRLPVVPAPPRPKPERSQSEYQREFKWHPSPCATPSPAPATPTPTPATPTPATPTPATPTPQTPEPTRPQLTTDVTDATKLFTTLAKTQAAADPVPQSPAITPIDIRHNGRIVREPEQMSAVGEPIAAGMPTKMDTWNMSLRHEGRQQTILSSTLEGKTKKIVALEASRLSKKSRSYSMYSLSEQLKTAEAAEELVNPQESEYKREFVNWAEFGNFAREELLSVKSGTPSLRRRGSWSGSLPTPLRWLGGFESQEMSKLQPAIPDSKSSRAPPKRPKTSAEFRNYHDLDYDDFAFESRPKSDKTLGRTTGLRDGKRDDSPYRNSSDDIYSVTDSSKARRDPYYDERRRDKNYDDRQKDRYDVHPRDRDHDARSRDRDYDERRRDYDYYDRQAGTAYNGDRYDDNTREKDHDLRNEYGSRRDDRYERSRDRDYDDRHSEATYSDRHGDRYGGRSRDREYDDRRGEARYADRTRERDYDGRTESRPESRYADVDRRSESRYGDRRSDRYDDRPHERDYDDRLSDSRYGDRRSDAAHDEKQDASRHGSGYSSRQAPDEGRYSERNGHSRNTSYSSQLSRGSGELSQPQSPAHPLSYVDNFRTRTRSSLSSNSSVSTPSSPPTPNGYDSADPRWRRPQGIYKEQLYSGVYSREGPMYEKERWQDYHSKDQTPLRRGYYYDEDEDEALEMPSRSRRGLDSGSHRSTRSPSPTSEYRKYNRRDLTSPNLSPAYSSRPPSRATSVSSHSTSIEEESALLSDMLREADTATLKSLTDRMSIFRVSRETRETGLLDTSNPNASTKRGSTTTKAGAKSTNAKSGAKTATTTKTGAKTTTATRTGARTTTATKTGLKTATTASKTSSAASSRRSSVMSPKPPMSPKSAVPTTTARKGHRPLSSAASSMSSTASLRSLGNLGMNERIPANSFSEARQALGRARAKVEEMLELVSNGSYDF